MKRFLSFFSLLLMAAVQMWAVSANPIAQITIGEDITSYYNPSELKTAAEAIEGEATIKILNDVTIANGLDFTKDDSNVILDLNGYTFTTWIYVSNSLTIRDNSDGQTGKMVKSSEGVLLYVEEGSLTIDGGTFVGTWCVCLDYQGHVTLNGGKFEAETYSFYLDSNDASLTLGKNKMMVNWIGRECQLVRGAIEGPCRVMEKTTPDPMAQITTGGTVTEYNELEIASFMHAAEFIEGEATIKLLTDVTLYDRLTFGKANTNITLDLNGCTFKCNIVVTGENSRLTICDNSDKQTGKIENSEDDFVINNIENGSLIIDGGMIVGQKGICLSDDASLTINGGKFKAPYLYVEDETSAKPIVMGGFFSMDPSDCVAEGYEVVTNDDEETKAEYLYKVVKKSSTPTAIEGVNADKAQKAIKTIENGRIVIIRGDKKYGLSGREL